MGRIEFFKKLWTFFGTIITCLKCHSNETKPYNNDNNNNNNNDNNNNDNNNNNNNNNNNDKRLMLATREKQRHGQQ